jgi:plasmid stabilization system protein ParE
MPGPELQLVWSPEAEDDLLTIWRWGAMHFSADVADAHLRDINRAAQNLTDFPNSGVKRARSSRIFDRWSYIPRSFSTE